jgi:membrane-associated protein
MIQMITTLFSQLTTFAAIPGLDLVDLIIGLGIFAIIFVIFAESGLLIGFFLPGDSLLFTAGVLYHANILPGNMPIPFWLFLILLFIAAVAGDTVGYWFGRKTGPHIFKKPDARIFKQSHIQKAQEFYEKHGGKTIIIARFVPIVRTFAPIVAGASKMHYQRFLAFNVIGGFVWTVGVTSLGYFVGAAFEAAGMDIDHVLLPIIACIILLSVAPPAIHILKDKKRRQALWAGLKSEAKSIFTPRKKKS